MKIEPIVIFNGGLCLENDPVVSMQSRGLMYGDGCFETLRTYDSYFLKWEERIERLSEGMEYLKLAVPFSSPYLKEAIQRLLRMNGKARDDAMVRIQCWRDGARGYYSASKKANWSVSVQAIPESSDQLSLHTSSVRAIPSVSLSRAVKLSNALNYVLAAKEANEHHYDDALMLTINGNVSEATSANMFWIKGNTVFTPSVECDLLPGIIRSMVIDVVRESGFSIQEGKFLLTDLLEADFAFATNSVKEILRVSSVDHRRFPERNAVYTFIKRAFENAKQEALAA
ncbi:MAG: aminotransferase class IV [Bacteroidota bacterium]